MTYNEIIEHILSKAKLMEIDCKLIEKASYFSSEESFRLLFDVDFGISVLIDVEIDTKRDVNMIMLWGPELSYDEVNKENLEEMFTDLRSFLESKMIIKIFDNDQETNTFAFSEDKEYSELDINLWFNKAVDEMYFVDRNVDPPVDSHNQVTMLKVKFGLHGTEKTYKKTSDGRFIVQP